MIISRRAGSSLKASWERRYAPVSPWHGHALVTYAKYPTIMDGDSVLIAPAKLAVISWWWWVRVGRRRYWNGVPMSANSSGLRAHLVHVIVVSGIANYDMQRNPMGSKISIRSETPPVRIAPPTPPLPTAAG